MDGCVCTRTGTRCAAIRVLRKSLPRSRRRKTNKLPADKTPVGPTGSLQGTRCLCRAALRPMIVELVFRRGAQRQGRHGAPRCCSFTAMTTGMCRSNKRRILSRSYTHRTSILKNWCFPTKSTISSAAGAGFAPTKQLRSFSTGSLELRRSKKEEVRSSEAENAQRRKGAWRPRPLYALNSERIREQAVQHRTPNDTRWRVNDLAPKFS